LWQEARVLTGVERERDLLVGGRLQQHVRDALIIGLSDHTFEAQNRQPRAILGADADYDVVHQREAFDFEAGSGRAVSEVA